MTPVRGRERGSQRGLGRRRRALVQSTVRSAAYFAHLFIQGLIVIVPVMVAVYVLLWLLELGENLAKDLVFEHVPGIYYFPGLGLILLIAVTLTVGWLASQARPRLALRFFEKLMRRTPLFGMVYSPVRDLMNLFGDNVQDQLGQVVLVKIPNTDMETLGFITRDDMAGLPGSLCKRDHVVVYVQWSSQIGGYCFVVPRHAVRPIDISVEEGMRWALTAGISGPQIEPSRGTSRTDDRPSQGDSRGPAAESDSTPERKESRRRAERTGVETARPGEKKRPGQ